MIYASDLQSKLEYGVIVSEIYYKGCDDSFIHSHDSLNAIMSCVPNIRESSFIKVVKIICCSKHTYRAMKRSDI